MNNNTTAYALMRVMEAVAGARAASPAASREMVDVLARQHFTQMIPAGVPRGVRTANKTGDITRIAHDAAIVFPPGRAPYVLVVLTRGFARTGSAAPVAREVSAAVWRHVARGRRGEPRRHFGSTTGLQTQLRAGTPLARRGPHTPSTLPESPRGAA
jgi:beta-lactamase class A